MSRKASSFLLVISLSLFSLHGCMTLVGKRIQGVALTTRPAGARVLVDGDDVGITPLGLKLAKKPPHVVRIEMDGYRPVEIRLRKRRLWPFIILPNLIWPLPILPFTMNPDAQSRREEFWNVAGPVLVLSAAVGAVVLDGTSQKGTVIVPEHLSVTLEKDAGDGRPLIILIDASDFRSITWISVLGDEPAQLR